VQLTSPVSRKAYLKYGGDFAAYWAKSNGTGQRTGFALEAAIAWRENTRRAKLGQVSRLRVTAAEGLRAAAADLEEVLPDGTVLRRFQVKRGWQAAIRALSDEKYLGMSVITTRESLETIEGEIQKAVAKAQRRGLPLPPKWQIVQESLSDGRLLRRLPGGRPLLRLAAVEKYVYDATSANWKDLASSPVGRPITQSLENGADRIANRARALGGAFRVAGKAFVVVDIAGAGYATWQDYRRYEAGEIGGAFFAFRGGIRTTQLALTYYAVVSPDPTFMTKVVAGTAAGVLIVVDFASEPIYNAYFKPQREAAERVLRQIERDERYHIARQQMIELLRAGV
jgi:hypothetical protein